MNRIALRNARPRKPIRMVLVLLATAAVQASLLAVSPPASAAPLFTGHIYETSGRYRVGAPSLDLYKSVVETRDGRVIEIVDAGGGYRKLRFQADTTKCVAASDSDKYVVVHLCDGNGVDWTIVHLDSNPFPNGHYNFQNREFNNKFLAGANDGTRFHLKTQDQAGWYYNFSLNTA